MKAENGATALETLLRRDRLLVAAGLALVVLLSWSWIVPMARDMYGSMSGPAAWMMATEWTLPYAAAMFAEHRARHVELIAARMFAAVAAYLLIFSLKINVFPGTTKVEETVLAALGYVSLLTGSFNLWRRGQHLALIAGAHALLFLLVEVGMSLSEYIARTG